VKVIAQEQFIFHQDPAVPESEGMPPPPTAEERRWMVDFTNNKDCPLYRYVGNDHARRKLAEAAFVALKRGNHCCRELSVFLSGPASVGKTSLMKLFAEMIRLPFIEIQPRSIVSVNDLFRAIRTQMEEKGLPIKPLENGKNFRLPPCILFIDEVHGLSQRVIDALLKACEGKECTLVTERGEVIDCQYVTNAIATTEGGDLFDAFETRFDEVRLNYYTREQLAKIVQINNPDLSLEVCKLIARFERLPRRLLRFADSMRNKKEMYGDWSWEKIALEVATDNGIDEFGMPAKHLEILKAIKAKPIAKDRLPVLVGVKKAELEKKLLPLLLCNTLDQPAMVEVTGEGYTITAAGIAELGKRNSETV
jgi:Holliday junction resolvasome RuvABC ATP-dependent DNA helicase subunit